ncbi:MAG: hypothetical protein ABMA14_20320, partial [Hyphomonadaceae bacterium]
MTAKRIRMDNARAADFSDAERRVIRSMSLEEISDKAFREVWGQDLSKVLQEGEKKEIVPRK